MVRLWPYRLPEYERQTVQKELAEMLKMEVIEHSHSPVDGAASGGIGAGEERSLWGTPAPYD